MGFRMNIQQMGCVIAVAALTAFSSMTAADVIAPAASDFAVLAGGNLSTGKDVRINGQIGAVGNIWLDRDVQVGSVIGMGNVSFSRDVAIDGDVVHHGSYWADRGTTVSGAVTDATASPNSWVLPSSTPASFTASSGSYWYDKDSDVTLTPGRYGSLSVSKDSTVRLSAGVYDFDHVWFDKNVKLVADTSGGAVTIQAAGNLTIGKDGAFADASGQHMVDVIVGGNIYLDKNAQVDGRLRAFGNASIDKDSTIGGSLTARGNVWLDKDVRVLGNTAALTSGGGAIVSAAVPEPAAAALMVAGAVLLAGRPSRRSVTIE